MLTNPIPWTEWLHKKPEPLLVKKEISMEKISETAYRETLANGVAIDYMKGQDSVYFAVRTAEISSGILGQGASSLQSAGRFERIWGSATVIGGVRFQVLESKLPAASVCDYVIERASSVPGKEPSSAAFSHFDRIDAANPAGYHISLYLSDDDYDYCRREIWCNDDVYNLNICIGIIGFAPAMDRSFSEIGADRIIFVEGQKSNIATFYKINFNRKRREFSVSQKASLSVQAPQDATAIAIEAETAVLREMLSRMSQPTSVQTLKPWWRW